jgi:hypothetical protein
MSGRSLLAILAFQILFLVSCLESKAQESKITDKNGISWGNVIATIGTGKKTSLHAEMQFRRLLPDLAPLQLLVRAGLNYNLDKNHLLHFGYCFVETHPYGDYPIAAYEMSFPEHRIYEQFNSSQTVRKLSMQYRFRLEQRWIGKRSGTSPHRLEKWTYLNRARFQIRAEHPLVTLGGRKFYAGGFNEVFIGFGKNIGANIFDQNRSCLLAGCKITPILSLEAGYFRQILIQGGRINNNLVIQNNSGLQISLFLKS